MPPGAGVEAGHAAGDGLDEGADGEAKQLVAAPDALAASGGAATDAELVVRLQQGDMDALGALVHRYVRLGGSVAYQVLGDYDRAADAVQDAFLRVHRSIGGLREPERFRSWFYGVVRSVAVDRLRRDKRRRGGLDDVPEEAFAYQVDPLDALALGEDQGEVLAAVSALSEGSREVIALKYLDGRPYDEIAALLGISVEAVESRLHRARQKLKQKLMGLARRSGLLSSGEG